MIFGSVCSGIEAALVAWHPLGWRAAFLSEIDAFPRAVLKHHYPGVPLRGDFTEIQSGDHDPIDILVGGTPCQSFSTAGLRGGLADERGNLALEFLRLVQRLCPRWVVWENVPGVLSATSHNAPDPCAPPDDLAEGTEWVGEDEYDADEDHAFSCFLAGLSEVGYGWAYRSFDAQFFGLAQRRERVFVVGYFGDWRRAAAVLFEPASLRGNPAPSREAREGVAPTLSARTKGGGGLGTDFECDGGLIQAFGGNNQSSEIDVATACNAHGGTGRMDFETETFITQALRAEGFDASENHAPTLDKSKVPGLATSQAVRRLTPRECERLQGFPDHYTLIPYRGGLAADGPRYKAIGNSMAVPCMRWIGRRIAAADVLERKAAA